MCGSCAASFSPQRSNSLRFSHWMLRQWKFFLQPERCWFKSHSVKMKSSKTKRAAAASHQLSVISAKIQTLWSWRLNLQTLSIFLFYLIIFLSFELFHGLLFVQFIVQSCQHMFKWSIYIQWTDDTLTSFEFPALYWDFDFTTHLWCAAFLTKAVVCVTGGGGSETSEEPKLASAAAPTDSAKTINDAQLETWNQLKCWWCHLVTLHHIFVKNVTDPKQCHILGN